METSENLSRFFANSSASSHRHHCDFTENSLHRRNPDGVLYQETDGASHRITIYFPNLSGISIRDMELEKASFLQPVKRPRKLLVYGDSITQGYDAHHPSFSYINRVADHFDMELINKAVGGDTFSAEMGNFSEDLVPERILIAYGTNDWSTKSKEKFVDDTEAFFRNLRKRYPRTPLHVLLPIWREDAARETHAGTFQEASDLIRNICAGYNDIQIIDGFQLFPQLSSFFEDKYLHPNDIGFLIMADNIIRELEKGGLA